MTWLLLLLPSVYEETEGQGGWISGCSVSQKSNIPLQVWAVCKTDQENTSFPSYLEDHHDWRLG